jgi:hypothetical protein
MHVIGRGAVAGGLDTTGEGPAAEGRRGSLPAATGHLGNYRARDGSAGTAVGIDTNRPHAALVVGKRGAGKSHTLGVLAEATARTDRVAPVVVDRMGAFDGLAEGVTAGTDAPAVPARVVDEPTVRADAVPPAAWPELVGLDPGEGPGALVWEAATAAGTLEGMLEAAEAARAKRDVRRAARNHLRRADSWGVFAPDGLDAGDLFGPEATVLSLAGTPDAPSSAVVAAVARLLYDARNRDEPPERLPWLFVDEAHVAIDGVAEQALRTVLTRGRAPGVSLVLATQRPTALPAVAASQADLLFAHRLTSEADIAALGAASPTYLDGSFRDRLPTGRGEALIIDDATESTHTVRIRERDTPGGGETPRASRLESS